jgi:hypothetical protein
MRFAFGSITSIGWGDASKMLSKEATGSPAARIVVMADPAFSPAAPAKPSAKLRNFVEPKIS